MCACVCVCVCEQCVYAPKQHSHMLFLQKCGLVVKSGAELVRSATCLATRACAGAQANVCQAVLEEVTNVLTNASETRVLHDSRVIAEWRRFLNLAAFVGGHPGARLVPHADFVVDDSGNVGTEPDASGHLASSAEL